MNWLRCSSAEAGNSTSLAVRPWLVLLVELVDHVLRRCRRCPCPGSTVTSPFALSIELGVDDLRALGRSGLAVATAAAATAAAVVVAAARGDDAAACSATHSTRPIRFVYTISSWSLLSRTAIMPSRGGRDSVLPRARFATSRRRRGTPHRRARVAGARRGWSTSSPASAASSSSAPRVPLSSAAGRRWSGPRSGPASTSSKPITESSSGHARRRAACGRLEHAERLQVGGGEDRRRRRGQRQQLGAAIARGVAAVRRGA